MKFNFFLKIFHFYDFLPADLVIKLKFPFSWIIRVNKSIWSKVCETASWYCDFTQSLAPKSHTWNLYSVLLSIIKLSSWCNKLHEHQYFTIKRNVTYLIYFIFLIIVMVFTIRLHRAEFRHILLGQN